MSKHATAGTSGTRRADEVQPGQRPREVQRGEVHERVQTTAHGLVDHDRADELRTAVDDPVPDRVERAVGADHRLDGHLVDVPGREREGLGGEQLLAVVRPRASRSKSRR